MRSGAWAGTAVAVIVAAYAVACATGSATDSGDGGGLPPFDAQVDGGAHDGTTSDGPRSDAPPTDGGGDTGSPADSGADTQRSDAAPDSGPADTGAPVDSGGVDAGSDSSCDPVTQMGCPPADKCTIYPPTCVANGTTANGQSCPSSGMDPCVKGDLCTTDSPDASAGICRMFCAMDSNCTQMAVPSGPTPEPNNTAHCLFTITGTPYKVCTVACNPVSAAGPSGCPAGEGCVYGGTTMPPIPELTDCETVGTGTDGTACSTTALCASGFVCVNNGSATICRQVCRNGNAGDCSNGNDICYPPSGVSNPMFGFCCDAINGC